MMLKSVILKYHWDRAIRKNSLKRLLGGGGGEGGGVEGIEQCWRKVEKQIFWQPLTKPSAQVTWGKHP